MALTVTNGEFPHLIIIHTKPVVHGPERWKGDVCEESTSQHKPRNTEEERFRKSRTSSATCAFFSMKHAMRSFLSPVFDPSFRISGTHLFPQDTQILAGSSCEHWIQDDGVSRIHIYIDSATQGQMYANVGICTIFAGSEPFKLCLLSHQPQAPSRLNLHAPRYGGCALLCIVLSRAYPLKLQSG